jgi:hypothetical protein
VVPTVVAWLNYFDEIVVPHPFLNASRLKPEFSPVQSPSKHKAQTLKNVFTLLILEPFINAGYVHLISDPSDFNAQFGMTSMKMAEARTSGWAPDESSMKIARSLADDDHKRLMRQLPSDSLARMIRQYDATISDKLVARIVERFQSERQADPFSLLQPLITGENGAQFLYVKGYSLEAAMFLAALTGSFIYTDIQAHWQQLQMHAVRGGSAQRDIDALHATVDDIQFELEPNPQAVLSNRHNGGQGSGRIAMRSFLHALTSENAAVLPPDAATQLRHSLDKAAREFRPTGGMNRLRSNAHISAPPGGFERNEVRRLLITFSGGMLPQRIVFAMLVDIEGFAGEVGERET